MIVCSSSKRKVHVSTGDISMIYLTDKECNDVVKVMRPHLKNGKYLEALRNGVLAIERRL